MNRRRPVGPVLPVLPVPALVLVVVLLLGAGACSANTIEFSGGMDRLDLWTLDLDTGKRTVVEIRDKDKMRSLFDKLDLGKSHDCGCDHTEGLTLYRDAEKVDVTICDHCFQIEGGADYDIPEEFYEEYKKLLAAGGEK